MKTNTSLLSKAIGQLNPQQQKTVIDGIRSTFMCRARQYNEKFFDFWWWITSPEERKATIDWVLRMYNGVVS